MFRKDKTNRREKEYYLWNEKYRPQTINDCILPPRLKDFFNGEIKTGKLQNMLFNGLCGSGKTSTAKALANELDCDILIINGSDERNIDTLRTKVKQFVSVVSTNGKRKIVLIDEADYLNRQSTQPALRNFMEEFSNTSSFIFTVNYPDLIFKELKSRMLEVDFNLSKDDIKKVIPQWEKRLKTILEKENIEFSEKVLKQTIVNNFPDYRKTINELQRYSSSGILDTAIMQTVNNDSIQKLIDSLKEKSFSTVRVWVNDNPNISFNELLTSLWSKVDKFVEKESIPEFVMTSNEYAFRNTMVVNQEINKLAYLTDLMLKVSFL